MFPEDPAPVSVMQPVPVMTVGKIRQRRAPGDKRFTVIEIVETGFNDTPERIKPGINIVKSVFQDQNLFPRYKKGRILTCSAPD